MHIPVNTYVNLAIEKPGPSSTWYWVVVFETMASVMATFDVKRVASREIFRNTATGSNIFHQYSMPMMERAVFIMIHCNRFGGISAVWNEWYNSCMNGGFVDNPSLFLVEDCRSSNLSLGSRAATSQSITWPRKLWRWEREG